MNLASTILRDVSAAGGKITLRDGRLKLSAPKPLPQALVNRIREAKPALLATLQPPLHDVTIWKKQYHELVKRFESQGHSLNEAQWKGMNETFLALCEDAGVIWHSNEGYRLMRHLVAATHFDPVPVDMSNGGN